MPVTPPPSAEGAGPEASTVSREKERLFVPPRAMVPAPGSGSVFGRGFFRRFHDSGVGYFLLIFLAVGTALFLFGVAGTFGPYKEGLRENGDPRFFLGAMAFGATFDLVALRMLQVALTETESGRTRRRRPGKGAKKEPWASDYPWRKDWMPPDYTARGTGTVLGRVAFFALIGLFNVAWLSGSWIFRAIIIVLDLFALLIVYDTLHKIYQAVRFRQPVVIWETLPAFLGGPLRGRIAFPRDIRAAAPPRLTLRCVRDEWVTRTTGTGSDRRQHTELEPNSIYKETREVPLPGEPGGPLEHVDFAFDVPGDLPGTDFLEKEAVYWQVVIDVPVAGPNLEAVFLAPVYQRR